MIIITDLDSAFRSEDTEALDVEQVHRNVFEISQILVRDEFQRSS